MSIKRIILPLLAAVILLSACGTGSEDDSASTGKTVEISVPDSVSEGAFETDEKTATIVLKGSSVESDSTAVKTNGSVATVTESGTYIMSGVLDDGFVAVEADKDDNVTLVLNGAGITSTDFSAIYIKQAKNVTISLADGSENYLVNGGSYASIDENNVDAVIFSKDDLILDGDGELTVKAGAGHGIVSKDDLAINGGTYNIDAASHGIAGKDSVSVNGATITVSSGKDGIHAENSDDASAGSLTVTDGFITVVSSGDGLSASGELKIDGGSFDITCGGGSGVVSGSSESTKGLKSTGKLSVNGGVFTIDSSDDAIHSNADVTVTDGTFTISTGDDGVHADGATVITGGELTVNRSYEGVEGLTVEISGGTVILTSDDDGINAAGGNDSSGFGGPRGGDKFGTSSSTSYIKISGGNIYVTANGDGLDSNGSLEVSGGSVYVSGPVSNGNGALDFGGDGIITGGTVIAVGADGMVQNFGSNSTQGSILLSVGTGKAGDTVSVTDQSGNVLAEFTAEKTFSSVVISCPGLIKGGTYTVFAGDFSQTVTLDSLIYGSGGGFGGGGFGGRAPGGFGR